MLQAPKHLRIHNYTSTAPLSLTADGSSRLARLLHHAIRTEFRFILMFPALIWTNINIQAKVAGYQIKITRPVPIGCGVTSLFNVTKGVQVSILLSPPSIDQREEWSV